MTQGSPNTKASAKPKKKMGARPDLTKKQDAFCQEYALNGGNATQAYRKGFTPKKSSDATVAAAASRLLTNAKVRLRIEHYQQLVAEAADEQFEVRAEDVLRELHAIAFFDARKAFTWGSRERPVYVKVGKERVPLTKDDGSHVTEAYPFMEFVSSEEMDPLTAKVVVGVEQTVTKTGDTVVTVKMGDKLGALKLLATHLKLLTNKVEHSGEVKTGPITLAVLPGEAEA